MAYIHPDAIEHHRKRWLRHDAHRFAKPGTPEAETGFMHPWAEVARREQAAADAKALAEAKARADQDALQREILDLRRDWAALKLEIAAKRAAERREVQELRRKSDLAYENLLRVFDRYTRQHKYSPDQPRVPAGNPDGGQWTDGGGSGSGHDDDAAVQDSGALAQDRGSFRAPGPGQQPRRDLVDLDAIANHPPIRARIDEAWAASDPNGFGREQGFWISRNDATGELSTRPFANPGGPATIVPGAMPNDAIAFFHTHPTRPQFGGDPGPSFEDVQYAARTGLPGLLQSHSGMYYFGPLLRPRQSP